MPATTEEQTVSTLNVVRDIQIAAPLDIVFESLLEELGPAGEMPTEDGGTMPFPMKIEPWPGGRWFRDLGGNAGHLWGHVQVIKPPTLLEICGPLFMSYAATSHVQYRLTAEGDTTRLKVTHRALGQIPQEDREGVVGGWDHNLKRVQEIAGQKMRGVKR